MSGCGNSDSGSVDDDVECGDNNKTSCERHGFSLHNILVFFSDLTEDPSIEFSLEWEMFNIKHKGHTIQPLFLIVYSWSYAVFNH